MLFAQKIKPENFIYLLVLLFLPTQFGRHFWPEFSYLSGARVDYLSPTIYFTDILIFVLLVLVFIKSFKISILKSFKKNRTVAKYLFLLLLVLVLNIIFSENIPASLYGTLKVIEFLFFGIYTFFKIKEIKLDLILFVFSISIIFESLTAIFQYLTEGSIGGLFYFLGERSFTGLTPGVANASIDGELVLRAYGTFSHPNVLSGFLLLTMTLILFNIRVKKFSSVVPISSIILGTAAVFLTFSRIPIFLWILSIFVFLLSRTKLDSRYRIYLSGVLLLTMLISFFFYAPFYLRFIKSSFFEDAFILRQKLFIEGMVDFLRNPIIGRGLNNYFSNTISYGNILVLQPVHNIFVLVLIQTGLLGFGVFIWTLFKVFIKVIGNRAIYPKLIFSYILLIGLFDHYFLTLQQGQLLFAFFIGSFLKNYEK